MKNKSLMKNLIILLTILPIAFYSFKKDEGKEEFSSVPLSRKFNKYIMVKPQPPSDYIKFGTYAQNQLIYSANHQYYLVVQSSDGNLVLYNAAQQGLWDSRVLATGASNINIIFRSDGTFSCNFNGTQGYYKPREVPAVNSGYPFSYQSINDWGGPSTGVAYSYWVLQDDGNLVRYNADLSESWSTETAGGIKSRHPGKFEHN